MGSYYKKRAELWNAFVSTTLFHALSLGFDNEETISCLSMCQQKVGRRLGLTVKQLEDIRRRAHESMGDDVTGKEVKHGAL